jgi:hypothetical protein
MGEQADLLCQSLHKRRHLPANHDLHRVRGRAARFCEHPCGFFEGAAGIHPQTYRLQLKRRRKSNVKPGRYSTWTAIVAGSGGLALLA